MKDILVVAPYKELADLAIQLKRSTEIPFSVIVGNMEEKIDEVKALIQQGTKIVISRGGTAEQLKKIINVPIIEIPVTSSDILRALSDVSALGYKKVAFIATSNVIFRANHFDRIVDIILDFQPCEDVCDIPEKVKSLIENKKVDAIIGDVNATREALKYGVYVHLLESGSEALQHSLSEAQRMLRSNTQERARLKQLQTILNYASEAVLTIDKDGIVTVYNSVAQSIFGEPEQKVVGYPLSKCLPGSKLNKILKIKEEEKDILLDINGKKVVCNRIPIIIDGTFYGAVAIFQEISCIQKLELNIRTRLSEKGFVAKHTFKEIVGKSKEIKAVISQALQYSKSDGTILIYGETGTGKEIFAQSIHNASKRADGPFVFVNCASLNENLLESELFGYEAGTFTGALKGGKTGLFELAHGGTLFLDEIGEISLNFQAKLLRVLQEREIRKVGGERVIPVNVRIICATNKDLIREVEEGSFREDLYYRLNVLELNLIPLREHIEDIVPLAQTFIKSECLKEQKVLYWEDESVFDCLKDYEWRGNARELHNFIERLVICSEDGQEITEESIKTLLSTKCKLSSKTHSCHEIHIPFSKDFSEMEANIWKEILEKYNGDRDRVCKEFQISKTTLWRKLNFKTEI